MDKPSLLTRQGREKGLESIGVTGAAAEAILRETTRERHESRVAYARWAAEEYYLEHAKLDREECEEDTLDMMVSLIAWADIIGIGGRDGCDGAATERHPAFRQCGKGRKQATDGEAWTAAIREVATGRARKNLYGGESPVNGVFAVNSVPCVGFDTGFGASTLIAEDTCPLAWQRSILREGLRRSLGLTPWHPDAPFRAEIGSASVWADALNACEDAITEEVRKRNAPLPSGYRVHLCPKCGDTSAFEDGCEACRGRLPTAEELAAITA